VGCADIPQNSDSRLSRNSKQWVVTSNEMAVSRDEWLGLVRHKVAGDDSLGVSRSFRENIPGLRGESGSALALALPERDEPLPPPGLLYFGVTTILRG